MPKSLYDDLVTGIKQNYYRSSDGDIVKVFALEYDAENKPSHFRACFIRELTSEGDISQGETIIPFQSHHLNKYRRIPEAEVQKLRKEKNKLEMLCQDS